MSGKILNSFFSSDSSITVIVRVSLTSAFMPAYHRSGVKRILVAQWYFHLGVLSHAGWKGFIAGDLLQGRQVLILFYSLTDSWKKPSPVKSKSEEVLMLNFLCYMESAITSMIILQIEFCDRIILNVMILNWFK